MRIMARKTICLFLCTMIAFSFCFGNVFAEDSARLQIIALNFPCYDAARTLCGETAEIRMLLPPGSESHSYEPTPQDIIAIHQCDLFLYVGGESDAWVESVLNSMSDNAPLSFRLMDCVTLLNEEASKSMDTRADEQETDEHVWTSPQNMMLILTALCNLLKEICPSESAVFDASLQNALQELDALDQSFREIVAGAKRKTIVFGDRFPFRYFAEEYGLQYDAAFPGCSEESEPSSRTVISLIDKIRKEQIPVVFYIEFSSRRTADILVEETGANELLFHSCHNVSANEIESGATYLSLMRKNAEALREALN